MDKVSKDGTDMTIGVNLGDKRNAWHDWAGWIPSFCIRSDTARDRRKRIAP